MSRGLARAALAIAGWRIVGTLPDAPKAVLIVAPHASNWDFLVGIVAVFALGLRISFLGKHTLFRFPAGCLFRWLGGIPVDRRSSTGVVEQTVRRFAEAESLILGLAPEGTRSEVARWKTGFYHIARGAGVPVVPVVFDYAARAIRLGPVFALSGDTVSEIDELRRFCCERR